MKRINENDCIRIVDLIITQNLTIADFALEKDFIVSEVLMALSKLENETFDLVFCGGTCLSKAYNLLDRISEDVDIKVVTKPDIVLSANQQRKQLSKLKNQVLAMLVEIGFSEEQITRDISALDGNRFIVFNSEYESNFDYQPALRAQLKLELNACELQLPAVERKIGLLFNQLANIEDANAFKLSCISVEEALVEKLVSFPRRLAMHLTDNVRFKFDKTLVRHLFDVSCILASRPFKRQSNELKAMLVKVIDKDAKEFQHQHPQFLIDPVKEIKMALAMAKSDITYRQMYDQFVAVMVYGNNVPSFDEALGQFETLLNQLFYIE